MKEGYCFFFHIRVFIYKNTEISVILDFTWAPAKPGKRLAPALGTRARSLAPAKGQGRGLKSQGKASRGHAQASLLKARRKTLLKVLASAASRGCGHASLGRSHGSFPRPYLLVGTRPVHGSLAPAKGQGTRRACGGVTGSADAPKNL